MGLTVNNPKLIITLSLLQPQRRFLQSRTIMSKSSSILSRYLCIIRFLVFLKISIEVSQLNSEYSLLCSRLQYLPNCQSINFTKVQNLTDTFKQFNGQSTVYNKNLPFYRKINEELSKFARFIYVSNNNTIYKI